MAKIAVPIDHAVAERRLQGAPAGITDRTLARGCGWRVRDVVCTSGPHDRPFEEQHDAHAVAVVLGGSFQYHTAAGHALMTPGSLLVGRAGDAFTCSHEHASGDRCLSFEYSPEFFDSIRSVAARPRSRSARSAFRSLRIPPQRELSPLISRAFSRLDSGSCNTAEVWEEIAITLAGRTLEFLADFTPGTNGAPPSTYARVTRAVRLIESRIQETGHESGAEDALSLRRLAEEARLSPYHFLRTFEHLTGLTPHQYIRRLRLRRAAAALATSRGSRVLDVALDCGFNDVSNFNHAFRSEFRCAPRAFRRFHAA